MVKLSYNEIFVLLTISEQYLSKQNYNRFWAQISAHIENLHWFLQRKLDYKNTTKQISYYLHHSFH